MSKSNCTKVHSGRDPGPCSAPKCGKFDPSNRYVHFCQKALDQPEFTDYVYRQYKITDTDCICRRCERTFKHSFLKFKAGEPDEASDAKRACTDNEDNKCFLSNFSLCSNLSNHRTEIDCLSFQQAFNVLISEKFPQYDDTFSSLLCHSHYNKFNKFINNETVQCIVCETNSCSNNIVFKTVGEEKRDLFLSISVLI